MGKHTPGPWVAEITGYIANHDVGTTICKIVDGSPADERLIAAAPDLLAALREAERVIRWAAQESNGRVRAEVVGGWVHHADAARAAIAKARGEA